MNTINKKAHSFISKYDCNSISCKKLLDILHSQGFSVIEFSHFYNDEETEDLLKSLHLLEFSKTVNAFTYVDSTMRLVFILEGLSEDEKLILLSHEEGHIFLGHMVNKNRIFGEDIFQEDEANSFSYIIRTQSRLSKFFSNIIRKKSVLISAIVLILLLGTIFTTYSINNLNTSYFVTKSGSKYHTKNCEYIVGHKTTKITKDDAKKLGYEPCLKCID